MPEKRRGRGTRWDPLTVGVDIGGTKVLAGVVDSAGTVFAVEQRPTEGNDPAAVEDTIVDLVQAFAAQHEVAAVGIGAAGFVDSTRSVVMFAPHLSWRREPLRAKVAERLRVPVVVDNDANTAALAESRFGAGRGHRYVLCVTLGTGIGGGVVDTLDAFLHSSSKICAEVLITIHHNLLANCAGRNWSLAGGLTGGGKFAGYLDIRIDDFIGTAGPVAGGETVGIHSRRAKQTIPVARRGERRSQGQDVLDLAFGHSRVERAGVIQRDIFIKVTPSGNQDHLLEGLPACLARSLAIEALLDGERALALGCGGL